MAAAGGSADRVYIEDVFSTYLYTGNGTVQPINNGIDLLGKGGAVWLKSRNASYTHHLFDTARGENNSLSTNNTSANSTGWNSYFDFTNNGFSIASTWHTLNESGTNFVSWSLRKQPKFFDVVTWTGNSTARSIAHNLGSTPGCIFVKVTNLGGENWVVWHRSINQDSKTQLFLNTTDAAVVGGKLLWGASGTNANMTSTTFSVGTATETNETGNTYVAYLFAHDAGGFGLTGTDNVISCGSFSTGSGNVSVTLGYEPQWVMYKRTDGAGNWVMFDTMRGWFTDSAPNGLVANDAAAEPVGGPQSFVNATGFNVSGSAGQSFIYIAIRRGPMKVPTTGTSVFAPQATAGATDGTPNSNRFTSNFPIDLFITAWRAGSASAQQFQDRLRSPTQLLISSSTAAETGGNAARLDDMDGVYFTTTVSAASNVGSWMFRRAPGFFDVVNSSVSPVKHNLGVVPELVITKYREDTQDWFVCGAFNSFGDSMSLNTTAVPSGLSVVTAPTATQFNSLATGGQYIYYIFASCPGVSKVGSYTGTAATQTINCGFTAGARFVLIKRTDDTGDWYVWDSARGIVAGDDPYLLLNSTAAEVTNTDYVDTAASGFELTSTAPADINASGGSFIFFAVA